MKKLLFLSLILTVFLTVTSCKKEKQNTTDNDVAVKNYIIDTQNSVINWTAYKTTEKIPVKGVFKTVDIKKSKPAANPIEVLQDLEFEVPVSGIFSKDSIRDYKLVTYFFGVMDNTLNLSGKVNIQENGKGNISLTMNGLTKELPFTYEVKGEIIEMKASMDLDTWQAQAAIAALNEVCNEKHKAADGISKTWNEVALQIEVKTLTE